MQSNRKIQISQSIWKNAKIHPTIDLVQNAQYSVLITIESNSSKISPDRITKKKQTLGYKLRTNNNHNINFPTKIK